MKYYLYIQADTNDADYIERMTKVSEETIELIKPVIEAINNFKSSRENRTNYPTGERIENKSAEDLYGHLQGFNTFDSLVPYDEYGIHTIEEIKLFHVDKVENLY